MDASIDGVRKRIMTVTTCYCYGNRGRFLIQDRREGGSDFLS